MIQVCQKTNIGFFGKEGLINFATLNLQRNKSKGL
jgi:hypothetical protein